MSESGAAEPEEDAGRRVANEARERVHFEEEALGLADQVYRVARRMVGTREEAEELVQDTYARAFRSWQSFTPGTNMRAWLLRILTNLNTDRGRKIQRTPDQQPLEESDYYLANRLAAVEGEQALDQEQVVERLSQGGVVNALADAPARLPRRRRPRRPGRVQLCRRRADPRHPDRDRDVAPPPRSPYPEEDAGGGDADMSDADCEKCEELLQGYLDRDLTPAEVTVAEGHLGGCDYCRRRYRFEAHLRRYIRTSASERMPAGLLAKLAELRGPTADGL